MKHAVGARNALRWERNWGFYRIWDFWVSMEIEGMEAWGFKAWMTRTRSCYWVFLLDDACPFLISNSSFYRQIWEYWGDSKHLNFWVKHYLYSYMIYAPKSGEERVPWDDIYWKSRYGCNSCQLLQWRQTLWPKFWDERCWVMISWFEREGKGYWLVWRLRLDDGAREFGLDRVIWVLRGTKDLLQGKEKFDAGKRRWGSEAEEEEWSWVILTWALGFKRRKKGWPNSIFSCMFTISFVNLSR